MWDKPWSLISQPNTSNFKCWKIQDEKLQLKSDPNFYYVPFPHFLFPVLDQLEFLNITGLFHESGNIAQGWVWTGKRQGTLPKKFLNLDQCFLKSDIFGLGMQTINPPQTFVLMSQHASGKSVHLLPHFSTAAESFSTQIQITIVPMWLFVTSSHFWCFWQKAL